MSETATIDEIETSSEQTVLREVLALWPDTVTESELIQLLGGDLSDRFSVERWEIPIRELSRRGLFVLEGKRVFPSLAAVTFFDFMDTWV